MCNKAFSAMIPIQKTISPAIDMTVFIVPGPLRYSSSSYDDMDSLSDRDLSCGQLRPGPMCSASINESKLFFLMDDVELSRLHFSSGDMCRRGKYIHGAEPPVKKEDKVLVAVIVGSLTSTNPFGHVAISIQGHGTYSFGTNTVPGESLSKYLAKQGGYRSSIVYTIETTEVQASAILRTIKSFVGMPLPDPIKDPRGFADTCATRTIKALEAGGYTNPKPTFFGNSPSIFPGDAANYGRQYGTPTKLPKGADVPDIFSIFEKK